jgi:hypothetical protein
MTDETAELQAQLIALRLAVEGMWLSLLRADADPVATVERLGRENSAAIGQLDASTPENAAMRDAVRHHTDRLWGSMAWQLKQDAAQS